MHPGGQLLISYRNRKEGLSQTELANQVNCSRSMIAQIEQGIRLPSGRLLRAMSSALGLDEVERAMLFLLYGRVQSGSMLPYVIATLRFDAALAPSQKQALERLVVQEYQAALEENRKSPRTEVVPVSGE